MEIREKLIVLSILKNGDWLSIYQELKKDLSLKGIKEKDSYCLKQLLGIGVVTILDEDYPECLKEMAMPPFVLFYRGNIELLKFPKIGVIGGNKVSNYGHKACHWFLGSLLRGDYALIASLQIGIETKVHQLALSKGKSIAVLSTGFNNLYPKENQRLYERLAEQQLVLTEYPLSVSSMWRQYYRSSQLIQSLSQVILVLEVADGDRRLKQLNKELESGKPIFVLPDYYHVSNSRGGLCLINKGAQCLMNWKDVLYSIEQN